MQFDIFISDCQGQIESALTKSWNTLIQNEVFSCSNNILFACDDNLIESVMSLGSWIQFAVSQNWVSTNHVWADEIQLHIAHWELPNIYGLFVIIFMVNVMIGYTLFFSTVYINIIASSSS